MIKKGSAVISRSANVDCARFIAAMLIMAHHIFNIGYGEYPFHEAWVYVEFFCLLPDIIQQSITVM